MHISLLTFPFSLGKLCSRRGDGWVYALTNSFFAVLRRHPRQNNQPPMIARGDHRRTNVQDLGHPRDAMPFHYRHRVRLGGDGCGIRVWGVADEKLQVVLGMTA